MRTSVAVSTFLLVCSFVSPAFCSEVDALAISAAIRAKHSPFGAIIDPMYAGDFSDQVIGYTRCGDSALWTGAYLAAESFRYKVTRSGDALNNVKAALAGLKALSDITGTNQLARCMVPTDWPYAAGVAAEESHSGVNSNPPWIWIGNTSRDQIVGAFFGLGVAYDMVDDPAVKKGASDLVTRLIGYISRHQWSPTDDITNSFILRPEELQMLLQVARHVNPANTVSGPFFVPPVSTAVLVDVQSNDSYYKFNLAYMSFYHLVQLQNNGSNTDAYGMLRDHTQSHQNPFFNIIDRALSGPKAAREAETCFLLDEWLKRPKRDVYVDLSKTVKVCGTEACDPVPVAMRPSTDFLWQRTPFQLTGGTGRIDGPGIDYILPYWMARYYGVLAGDPVQSAAAPSSAVAPGSLASLYGSNLAATTTKAAAQPLPLFLGGVTVSVTDASGAQRSAPLHYVSPGQINFIVPEGTISGPAKFTVSSAGGSQTFAATVALVSPKLFSMNGQGSGVAAATAVSIDPANFQSAQLPVFQCTTAGCTAVPIALPTGKQVYVTLYGTGIRNLFSLANATVTVNGAAVPVLYAGPSPGYAGLDQVDVQIPAALRGTGEASVVFAVDGQTSNVVTLNIQ